MSNTLEVLKAARSLLANRNAWVQGMLFGVKTERFNRPKDAEILPVSYVKSGKVIPKCFCCIGAICYAGNFYDGVNVDLENSAVRLLAGVIHGRTKGHPNSVIDFNDARERTHEEVLDLFDRAILQAQQQT